MVQLELIAGIIGVVVILAVFVPLTFDSESIIGGFQNVTKALCNINVNFLGNSTLVQCTQPDDTFDFIAGTGIILTANNTEKTITFNSTGVASFPTQICPATEFFDAFFAGNSTFRCTPETGGGGSANVFMNNTGIGIELFKEKSSDTFFIKTLVGTGGITITNSTDEVFINGTSLDEIFTNLGTGSQVFKNETGTEVFFRTLINGSGIAIQQDAEEISIRNTGVIDLANVGNGSRVFKNVTDNVGYFRTLVNSSGIDIIEENNVVTFEVNTDFAGNLTQFDNFEWARSNNFDTFASNTPKFKKDVFTNYRVNILEFADKSPPADVATWTSALPSPFPNNATVVIDLYWYIESAFSPPQVDGDGVCWEIGIIGIPEDTTLDVGIPPMETICRTGLEFVPVDELMIETFSFTQSEHALVGKDLVAIFVSRDTGEVLDDWSDVADFLGLRIVWDSEP